MNPEIKESIEKEIQAVYPSAVVNVEQKKTMADGKLDTLFIFTTKLDGKMLSFQIEGNLFSKLVERFKNDASQFYKEIANIILDKFKKQ